MDDCGECGGDGSSCATTTVDVLYDFDVDVAGFQFDVTGGEIVSVGAGDASAAGFSVQAGSTTVLGFSLSGAEVSAGSGTLLTYEVT